MLNTSELSAKHAVKGGDKVLSGLRPSDAVVFGAHPALN